MSGRNRVAAVDKFRTDPECRVFLISLKAGGLGLNLTEAEVVFLLDPWWNPAVEAQAIDRTHRIGQTRPVFAYRLVSKDTVEEKVFYPAIMAKETKDMLNESLEEHLAIRRLLSDQLSRPSGLASDTG